MFPFSTIINGLIRVKIIVGLYYGVSICLVSFASGLSVVTLNLHHRGLRGTAVPFYLRRIILDCLARIVFLKFEADPAVRQRSAPPTSRTNSLKSKSVHHDPRCTCNQPPTNESISRKRRKPAVSVTQSSLSAWYSILHYNTWHFIILLTF